MRSVVMGSLFFVHKIQLQLQRRPLLCRLEERVRFPINSKNIIVTKTSSSSSSIPMGSNSGGSEARDPSSNPKVTRLRELVTHHSADGWEKCWEEGVIPWDLGKATPLVPHLLQNGTLPKGRVLIPGCGTGYDVIAMASSTRYVIGLDISASAVDKAKEWSSSLPNANYFTFLVADFFTWQPAELFDMVFDYTFFCAIDPSMRPSWARKINEILQPDGELITLIYLLLEIITCGGLRIKVINDQDGGPPYNCSVADYTDVLIPLGFRALSIVENEMAVGPRKGKEKVGRWKRSHSSI